MVYISTKEASNNWDISERRIRGLCQEGRIEGAVKIGRNWAIPVDAHKPVDARQSEQKKYLGLVCLVFLDRECHGNQCQVCKRCNLYSSTFPVECPGIQVCQTQFFEIRNGINNPAQIARK